MSETQLNDDPRPHLSKSLDRVRERVDLIVSDRNTPTEWLEFGALVIMRIRPGEREDRRDQLVDVAATALLALALLEDK